MNIKIIPCEGMPEGDTIEYVTSIFNGQKTNFFDRPEGIKNGAHIIFDDDTMAYLYRTKTEYVIRFDEYGGGKNA